MIVNKEAGTRVDEVAAGLYRICTPSDVIPGRFTFNSYLIADHEPLLFHTGYRKMFPLTFVLQSCAMRRHVSSGTVWEKKMCSKGSTGVKLMYTFNNRRVNKLIPDNIAHLAGKK